MPIILRDQRANTPQVLALAPPIFTFNANVGVEMSINRIFPDRFDFWEEEPAWSYAERQSTIARLWEAFFGTSPSGTVTYSVNYDAPSLPGTATYAAARALLALDRHPPLQEWFRRNIGRVIIHCAPSPDAIAILGDGMHFFQVKDGGDPWERAICLFDRLTHQQQSDYSSLAPAGTPAREDFASVFGWILASRGEEGKIRDRLAEICSDVSQWSNSATAALLATTSPSAASTGSTADDGDWTEQKNDRRCDLIDQQIAGALSHEERLELDDLQRQATAYRDRTAPLPLAGALRLHTELLEKKKRNGTKG